MFTRRFFFSLKGLGLALMVLLIAACQSDKSEAKLVSASSLPVVGTDPLKHTVYLKSDEDYYYFGVQDGKSYQEYRVKKGELAGWDEAAVGGGGVVIRNEEGDLTPVKLKAGTEEGSILQ